MSVCMCVWDRDRDRIGRVVRLFVCKTTGVLAAPTDDNREIRRSGCACRFVM